MDDWAGGRRRGHACTARTVVVLVGHDHEVAVAQGLGVRVLRAEAVRVVDDGGGESVCLGMMPRKTSCMHVWTAARTGGP